MTSFWENTCFCWSFRCRNPLLVACDGFIFISFYFICL